MRGAGSEDLAAGPRHHLLGVGEGTVYVGVWGL